MDDDCDFEMSVEDVAGTTRGQTLLGGRVTGSSWIRRCRSELVVNGVVIAHITVSEEVLDPPPRNFRSVSTADPIDVEFIRAHLGKCRLRGLSSRSRN